MQRMSRIFWTVVLSTAAHAVLAAQAELAGIQYGAASQVSFALPGPVKHHAFVLKSPSRLVVDFVDAKFAAPPAQPPADHPLFLNVRSGMHNGNDVRVVVELKSDADAKAALSGNALQIQLTPKDEPVAALKPLVKPEVAKLEKAALAQEPVAKPELKPAVLKSAVKAKGRDIVVAIDAGHGGKDVGAQGNNGTQEKDVVLAIAKRLAASINRQPGMKAVMIRNGDYFVKLRERVRIAQDAKADLFVSIHADAFDDPSAHGASVYTLSNNGASSAVARFLADSENAADKVGGGDGRDEALASVLMDLSQKAAKDASLHIGNKVLKNVKSVGHLHRSNVQKAGFVVLKSPIPSILVETAFISNPDEERRLNSAGYQQQMASAVFGGIMAHFRQYAPAGTLMAQLYKAGGGSRLAAIEKTEPVAAVKPEPTPSAVSETVVVAAPSANQHVIGRGETLSEIAQQYGVSMRAIRDANAMNDGNLRAGQVIQIPRSS